MSLTAFVPVKGLSSRLPGKNWLPFNGTTLLGHKIGQLKEVLRVDQVIVSSESDLLLEIAQSSGVKGLKRPFEFANESRPFSDFVNYVAEIVETDHIMWSCATSPMVGPRLYGTAIDAYFNGLEAGFDSLVTTFPFRHYVFDDKGPLNFERGSNHKNSQDLPDWDLYTNGVILAPTSRYKEWGYNYGPNPLRFRVSQFEAIDIDTEEDYVAALAFHEKYGRQI
jgi:CMP-N-acetylneuraminic acid synthetase